MKVKYAYKRVDIIANGGTHYADTAVKSGDKNDVNGDDDDDGDDYDYDDDG